MTYCFCGNGEQHHFLEESFQSLHHKLCYASEVDQYWQQG